jgi:epidermal growth factor receptor substrate 15
MVFASCPLHFLSHHPIFRNLADTQDRGALDSTDFAIGMYLIQASMSGHLSVIPPSLPQSLYDQAAGVISHATGGSASGSVFPPPTSRVPHQYTGPSSQLLLQPDNTGSAKGPRLPARPLTIGNAPSSPFGTGQTRVHKWDVTPEDKAKADRFFDTLDPQKKGYIEGDVAVPFMLESKLDGEVLAQVWCVHEYVI